MVKTIESRNLLLDNGNSNVYKKISILISERKWKKKILQIATNARSTEWLSVSFVDVRARQPREQSFKSMESFSLSFFRVD